MVPAGTSTKSSMHGELQPCHPLTQNLSSPTRSERLKLFPSPIGVKPTLKHQSPQMQDQSSPSITTRKRTLNGSLTVMSFCRGSSPGVRRSTSQKAFRYCSEGSTIFV